ncbi:phasin family protein [Bradyrhizobium liaoningense]|uniref:phasin family protein n=1 Tax=Bradyrhizobium liaoningense TaxID=43992 RepID=UPI001BAC080E|nr:phasin family protein [Bradyrhizobium liaoningense]MBR0818276.1 phasin family protein [Bradyrhizobium liaoningense]
MLGTIENKPKSGRRGAKKKAGQRTKAGEQRATAAHQLPDATAEISQENNQETKQENRQETGQEVRQEASQETIPEISAQAPSAAAVPGEASGMEITASAPVASLEPAQASTQAIADAYSDYTRTSLEHAWTLLGKLATARSPIEAFELQMEYAKQVCESFVAKSQEIAELHEQMTRQRVMHFEGFVARLTQTTLEIRATRH